jgi:hypothetical protein
MFLFLLLTSGRNCEEPHCSKYDFEEKVLEKMVRMEFKMENMKSEVELCVKRVESIKMEVSDQMKTNQQELEKGLEASIKEVSSVRAEVKTKLNEFKGLTGKIAFIIH